jgi:glutamate-ammonia-ligase adenylyltransferase
MAAGTAPPERSTLKALHRILQKGLIGHDDSHQLSENYLYLRTLEHRIQQVNDLQTHSLPASERDLGFLALKMGYPDRTTFLADLQKRRLRVRGIYDSLFQQTPGELRRHVPAKPCSAAGSGISTPPTGAN